MKKIVLIFLIVICLPLWQGTLTAKWGFYSHRKINHYAVFTLPPSLFGFYKQNIDYLTEHAVDPDKRRYSTKGEAPRHYIDIDHYSKSTTNPFEEMPRKWEDAVAKYTEDTLQAYGILPWHINLMVIRLSRAFQDQNIPRVLQLSADLGHYIGDAHVPLHTTENYNGALTDQRGIHGFWETRLPELFDYEYSYFVERAKYIEDVQTFAWEVVEQSHFAVDSVLRFERELNATFPTDRKYSYENRGVTVMQVYSEEYAKAYEQMLDGMVERRLRQSVNAIGSLWYTAWVNAGQPDLLQSTYLVDEELQLELIEVEKKFKAGEVKGRVHEN
jgi:hypothetical protein